MPDLRSAADRCRYPIAELPVGHAGGLIGTAAAPRLSRGTIGAGEPFQVADDDLDAIAAWQAAVVVTLIGAQELAMLGIQDLGTAVRARRIDWLHWPIPDFGTPDATFDARWPLRSAMLRGLLAAGGRVLVHCRGGLGRSGMVAARLLADAGMAPDAAIRNVRRARPHSIETRAQEAWVAEGRAD